MTLERRCDHIIALIDEVLATASVSPDVVPEDDRARERVPSIACREPVSA